MKSRVALRRNDRLETEMVFRFNERDQEGIAGDFNDHDLLPRVHRLVLVRHDFKQATGFHRDCNLVEGHASLPLQQVILIG